MPGDFFVDVDQLVDVRKIKFGIDALREQVHGQSDDIGIAGSLAVAEQSALDPVGAGQHAQFGRCDSCAAVIVRMQADQD